MVKTDNQIKGDAGEQNAKDGDRFFKGRVITDKPSNNKGYDYEYKDGNLDW